MQRTCKLRRGVDVLIITAPNGKPRKDGTVAMRETGYIVTPIDSDRRVAYPAFRLEKIGYGSDVYDVCTDAHGERCTCGDFEGRRINTQETCKHVLALKANGLI